METQLSPVIAHLRTFPNNRNRRSQSANGRQPKLTKTLALRFCDLISQTHESLFDLIEQNPWLPHHKTLFNWQQRVPWFAEMWKQARIRQTQYIAQHLLKLAQSADPKTAHVVRVRFDIYKWYMAKFNPELFGDKPFAPQQSTTVNVGISITPERLTEIRANLDNTRSVFAKNGKVNHASKPESLSRSRSLLTNGDVKPVPKPDTQPEPET